MNWTQIGLNWTASLKCLEITFAMIWRYINKQNWIELDNLHIFYRMDLVVTRRNLYCTSSLLDGWYRNYSNSLGLLLFEVKGWQLGLIYHFNSEFSQHPPHTIWNVRTGQILLLVSSKPQVNASGSSWVSLGSASRGLRCGWLSGTLIKVAWTGCSPAPEGFWWLLVAQKMNGWCVGIHRK